MAKLQEFNGHFCESQYEYAFIAFLENEGWNYLPGTKITRTDRMEVLNTEDLCQFLSNTNPDLNDDEIKSIIDMAFRINSLLKEYFLSLKVKLVDFKLEFGRLSDGSIVLADEISPDTCRLWDAATGEKLDKDRFRRDLGGVEEAYAEIMHRLEEHL